MLLKRDLHPFLGEEVAPEDQRAGGEHARQQLREIIDQRE